MLKREMRPENWYVTFFGAMLIILGYWLVSPITRDYETPKAFFAILTLNIGLLTVIIGLAVNFTWLEQILAKGKKNKNQSLPQMPEQSAAPSSPEVSQQNKSKKRRRG